MSRTTQTTPSMISNNGMPQDKAQALLKDLGKLLFSRVPVKAPLTMTLSTGLAHELAIYDSAYIARTKCSGYPLISIDERQSRAAISEGVSVIPITRTVAPRKVVRIFR